MGLNAGGKNKAQSAYYLPLERVVSALKLLQQQWPLADGLSPSWSSRCVPRGDLQTTFVFKVRRSLQAPTPLSIMRAHTLAGWWHELTYKEHERALCGCVMGLVL